MSGDDTTRHGVEDLSHETFDRVWSLVTELGLQERHFNDLESRYRALASTWLLAAFFGMGFVISQETLTLPFDRLLVVAGIGLAGTVGIALLWNLDLLVYPPTSGKCVH